MKPIYRCEYCDFTGIEEDVLKHEETCNKNYNLKWKRLAIQLALADG